MVDDRNDSVGSQEPSEVSSLMIDEYDEKHDNLVVISYEDDQQHIHITEDQSVQDCHSDSSSYVSCLEMFFQEEIFPSTCSEFFEDQEHTLTEVHCEGRSESDRKSTRLNSSHLTASRMPSSA